MISNERPSPYGNRIYQRPNTYGGVPHQRQEEDTLKTETVQVERKTFHLTLKENPRGKFLRITEEVNGRRNNIMIPATGLEEFQRVIDEMVKADAEIPPKSA